MNIIKNINALVFFFIFFLGFENNNFKLFKTFYKNILSYNNLYNTIKYNSIILYIIKFRILKRKCISCSDLFIFLKDYQHKLFFFSFLFLKSCNIILIELSNISCIKNYKK